MARTPAPRTPPGMPPPGANRPGIIGGAQRPTIAEIKARANGGVPPAPAADNPHLANLAAKEAAMFKRAAPDKTSRTGGIPADKLDTSASLEFAPTQQVARPGGPRHDPKAQAQQPRIRENINGGRGAPRPSIGDIKDALRPPAPAPLRESMLGTTNHTPLPESRNTDVPFGYVRAGLPSRCVPYDFNEIYIRPFEVMDLSRIIGAYKNKNYTMILDTLSSCMTQDIRLLTEPDLRHCMYWWRLNSFPRSPYRIRWTSRYGHENESTITNSTLRVEELKMTRDEYAKWKEKGLRFPTVRDSEAIREAEPDAGQEFLLERAQYVHVDHYTEGEDWFKARIERMQEGGIAMLEDIREFSELITHGVVETIADTDKFFVAAEAAKYLRDTAESLLDLKLNNGNAVNQRVIMTYVERADELIVEAKEIEDALAAGQVPQPRKEDIVLTLDIMSFFPSI